MAGGYGHRPEGVAGLKTMIVDLQRQINELRSSASSRSTGLVDANGNVVPLSEQVTRGAQAVSIPGSYTDEMATNFSDTGYVTAGDTITFHTYTGRFMLLNIASQVTVLAFGASGNTNSGLLSLGYTASGAVTLAADDSRACFMGTGADANLNNSASGSLIYADIVDGAPGEVSVQQAYKVYNDEGETWAEVKNRVILVLPF